jgi:4-hydroxyphenylacetate 3-monooxygenase/4-hydroxybutyryl-CoA dehydratase/vinylacetyl-CoA-Delta-isomerase
MANDPQYADLFTAKSHYTGEKINRFNNVPHSIEDLLTKQKMIRIGTQKVGFCIQRCIDGDMVTALSVVTKEIDDAHGTGYYPRFLKYVKDFQGKDLVVAGAQTDVKGDRSKHPAQQVDPDLYVRIVERRNDGIIVRGSKVNITHSAYADEIIVLPTRRLSAEETDWAVAFAIPADWEGVYLINRAAAPRDRKHLKAPLNTYGSSDAMIVFDDVFIPWERVFMCGEHDFANRLAVTFALYHRHSYTGCKPAIEDIIMGLVALSAEYYGVEQAWHIRDKLAHLAGIAELIFSAGIASAVTSTQSSSGTQIPDTVFANVGRRLAGENAYTGWAIAADVAGGFPVTMPFEEDYFNPETASFINKYTIRSPKTSPENMHRLQRTLSDYLASAWSGTWQVSTVHGGGSPVMETIAILNNYDFDERKKIAKYLAGIED